MTPYYAPRKTVPLARQAECLAFAAREHGMGFWSYVARYNDITAFQMKGWPEAKAWFDLPEALIAAGETLALVAELARHRGDAQLLRDLQSAVERAQAEAAAQAPASSAAGGSP